MLEIAFETALGYSALACHGETVLALCFGHSTKRAALRKLANRTDANLVLDASPWGCENLIERLQQYALGEAIDFDDVSLDYAGKTLFQRKVLQACRAIPWGETRTYGQLALDAGYAGAARAVGSVMSSNRVPLIIPCHRVLSASGLGGFSAPRGVSMKLRLLRLENCGEKFLLRPRCRDSTDKALTAI